jgi:hypothetical protein
VRGLNGVFYLLGYMSPAKKANIRRMGTVIAVGLLP